MNCLLYFLLSNIFLISGLCSAKVDITALADSPREIGKLRVNMMPSLEIYNKSANSISVSVVQDRARTPFASVASGSCFESNPAMKQEFTVYIIDNTQRSIMITMRPDGKNMYLTWDDESAHNGFRVQTGPMNGLKGVTESGLSLKNNVNKTELQECVVSMLVLPPSTLKL